MSTKTYRKLQVVKKTNDLKAATEIQVFSLVEPEPNQVRIKVIYAGVNIIDLGFASGRHFIADDPPHGLGFESIGIIDAIGSSIPTGKFHLNQAVQVTDLSSNLDAFSEYQYKEIQWISPLPNLKPEYIVAHTSGVSGAIGIDKAGLVKQGDKVLVVAAAGGTGQIAVQWAKHRGAYVIGTTSSEEKEKFLKQIGTDFVINYKKQDLAQVLKDDFPNGIDVIWEANGGESLKLLFGHLANFGRLIVVGTTTRQEEDAVDVHIKDWNWQLLRGNKSLTGFGFLGYTELFPEYIQNLVSMIDEGKIIAAVDFGEKSDQGKFVGLESVVRAEEYLQQGKNIGKVLVHVQNV